MYRKIIGMCLFFACIHAASGQKYTLYWDKEPATYYLHLPKGYDKLQKYPLIVNFHGMNSTAIKHQDYCQMDDVADKEGFITVYPQSNHKGWNAGLGLRSYTTGPDDIAYFGELLDTLEATLPIDKNRIYVTGVSMGGSLAYRIACEMSNRVAAIAVVAGLMTDSTLIYCNPSRNIPVLHIHGTNDIVMRYAGMNQALDTEEVVKFWELKNQCENKPDTIQIPNREKKDRTKAILIKYKNCTGGSQVWFYKIEKGGHTWPSGAKAFKLMGKKCKDFDGSQAIWDFFEQFTLQTGVSLVEK